MQYKNPVILSDYPDPDVIRAGRYYYMVSSSYNFVPGVPLLKSENLAEWEIAGYILKKLPAPEYNVVRHGSGAVTPSVRYHGGKYYCLLSFDDGIYACEADDIEGEWSYPRPVLRGKGFKSPCPLWDNGRCFVTFSAGGERAGASFIAVSETDENLTAEAISYAVIYSEPDIAPEICSPKIYKRGEYFCILASAGGKKSGWQVMLRSKNLYKDYETKIVLMQGETDINGPVHGAIADTDGVNEVMLHTQDMGAYGSVVHVQPARFEGDDFFAGDKKYTGVPGVPAPYAELPAGVSDFKIEPGDDFSDGLSNVWQTHANPEADWFEIKRGLKLNCAYYGLESLSDLPQIFSQKINFLNFAVNTKCKLNLINDGDETGLVIFGRKYAYICVVRRGGQNFLELREGDMGGLSDTTLARSQPYNEDCITFKISAKYEERNALTYKVTFGKVAFTHKFYAEEGFGTGARIGIYARADGLSGGYATYKYFKVICTDNRIG